MIGLNRWFICKIHIISGIKRNVINNSSPSSKADDFSTPIEGPDNQFGSAERSDDEDEAVTDIFEHNITRNHNNKAIYESTPKSVQQNVSYKVKKIISNLETGVNKSSVLTIHSTLLLFVTIVFYITRY